MAGWSPLLDRVYNPLLAGSIDGTDEEPHDRAIARAMGTKYKPNKLVQGDPRLTLFVARLSPETNEDTLFAVFRNFGVIKQVRLVRDIVTGFSKCYAFVEFESEKALRHAYSEGRNIIIDDKEVLIDFEHERTLKNWVPRRLGGGFGGKKESGQLRFGCRDRPFRKPIPAASRMRQNTSEHRSDSFNRRQRFQDADRNADSDYASRRRDYDRHRKEDYDRSRRDSHLNSSRYEDKRRRQRSRSPYRDGSSSR